MATSIEISLDCLIATYPKVIIQCFNKDLIQSDVGSSIGANGLRFCYIDFAIALNQYIPI